jgi:hypothetical protein
MPAADLDPFGGDKRIVTPHERLADKLDLHVVYLLALLVPIALAVLPIGWALVVIAVLPQGLILTRASHLRRIGRPVAGHILFHEASLVFLVAVCAAGWYFLHRP